MGIPEEIYLLIGSFLRPRDLVRAQQVNKSWYSMFGRDSLWVRHLSPIPSHLSRPPKVEYAFQMFARKCWETGELEMKNFNTRFHLARGACSPDGSWMILIGEGMVYRMRELESSFPTVEKIGGERAPLNPHQSSPVFGFMVSPDCTSAFTFGENGYFVKWKGLETNQITATLIAGKGCSLDPHRSSIINRGAISKDGKWALTFAMTTGEGVYWKGLDTHSPTGMLLTDTTERRSNERVADRVLVNGCSISTDGHWALIVGQDADERGFMDIWRGFDTGTIHRTVVKNCPYRSSVEDCVISLDGSWALTIGDKSKLIQWRNLTSDTPTPTLILPSTLSSSLLKLSPDGSWAIVGESFVVHHLNEVPVVRKWDISFLFGLCIAPSSSAFVFWGITFTRYSPPIQCTEE